MTITFDELEKRYSKKSIALEKAETALAALKKDARILAEAPEKEWWSGKVKEAARRILAATEEE